MAMILYGWLLGSVAIVISTLFALTFIWFDYRGVEKKGNKTFLFFALGALMITYSFALLGAWYSLFGQ